VAEWIHLDPTEVATGRTQLDITPWIDAAGVDWGEPAVSENSAWFASLDAYRERARGFLAH
jgi:hypothetical protein